MGGDVDGDVTADTNNDAQDVSNDNANLVTGTTSEGRRRGDRRLRRGGEQREL